MKIVVAVRQVVDLDEDFELTPDGLGVEPDCIERELNEWDTFALEEALALKDERDADVLVVTVGDDEADEALRACLAKGADRAIRVDRELDGASDPLLTARLLTAVIAEESPDLVLCGVQASDTVNGATGAALAALLALPCVAVARAVQTTDGGVATVDRELEGGTVERIEVALPALLTVQTGINQPRYATLRAIKHAKDKPLTVLAAADLGLTEGTLASCAGARLRILERPEHQRSAQFLNGDAVTLAGRIAEIIEERLK
jgi:electron transfer flavoprotein beta subunit